jgi:hypothetical protein
MAPYLCRQSAESFTSCPLVRDTPPKPLPRVGPVVHGAAEPVGNWGPSVITPSRPARATSPCGLPVATVLPFPSLRELSSGRYAHGMRW